MIELIHAADVHLSADPREREYSLSVLAAVVERARAGRAAWLVLAGDVFDSFRDAEALRAEFRRLIAPLAGGCEVLVLPGNHEQPERGAGALRALDLGAVTLLDGLPFTLLSRDGLEFLAVPHQADYRGYRDWPVAPKGERPRVAVAHGVVNGLSYAGLEEETGGSALDPDLFQRFGVGYAALGHIHARREEVRDGLHLAYPGSARVWRRGETGERGVNRVALGADGAPRVEFVPLPEAGRYRPLPLPVGFDGTIEEGRLGAGAWGGRDWVCLELSGIVEDEATVARLEEALQRAHGKRVRRLEIRREGVGVLPGIAGQPLAAKFLRLWREAEPPGSTESPGPAVAGGAPPPGVQEVWLRARELGLQRIRRLLEDRR